MKTLLRLNNIRFLGAFGVKNIYSCISVFGIRWIETLLHWFFKDSFEEETSEKDKLSSAMKESQTGNKQ